jgi:hypothetical protein
MTTRIVLSAAGIVLLLANPGWAQSTTSSPPSWSSTPLSMLIVRQSLLACADEVIE